MYKFDIPDAHKSIIKVIGVGGGGSNAVNYMFKQGIKDVEFIICNTDSQHLRGSAVPNKIQIGLSLTKGLGAGANPEKGRESAVESKEELREKLSDGTRMVFITAGMGGGTGTGAAPILAKIAKELDILTIGIVTLPFKWEGPGKKKQAMKGIEEMKQSCDTVIIINNDKLRELYGSLEVAESYAKANDVLLTAAKSIAEVITVESEINVDFADVERVMKNSGAAVMGSAAASGENRAIRAIEEALYSPLIDQANVFGAQNILLCVNYGPTSKFTMDELTDITDYITEKVGEDADVIHGIGIDPELGDAIRVTIICTGFENNIQNPADAKKIYDLQSNKQIPQVNQVNPVIHSAPVNTTPSVNDINVFQKPVNYSFEPPVQHEEIKVQPKQEDIVQPEINFNAPPDYKVIKKEEPVESGQEIVFTISTEKKVMPLEEPSFDVSNQNEQSRGNESFEERIKRLNNLVSTQNIELNEFKNMLEVPAYIRKQRELKDYPHSSERNISRFTLNEDNDLLGNNKFLHDNVD